MERLLRARSRDAVSWKQLFHPNPVAVWWYVSIRVSGEGWLFLERKADMQINIGEVLVSALASGLVEKLLQGDDTPSVQVLLYGAKDKPIEAEPDELLNGLRQAALLLERQREVVGDLASQLKSLLTPFGDGPTTFQALKGLSGSMVPILAQAGEKLLASKAPWGPVVHSAIQRLIADLRTIESFAEGDESLFGVERVVTICLRGPAKLVEQTAGELEDLARKRQAESLEALTTSGGVKVAECPNGHVVIIQEDKTIHTNVNVTQEMREVLGEKLLRNTDEFPCDDQTDEDNEEDIVYEDEDEETTPSDSLS